MQDLHVPHPSSAHPARREPGSPTNGSTHKATPKRYPGKATKVVTALEEMDKLAPAWPAADGASIISRFPWVHTCAVTFALTLRVMTVTSGDEVLAAAPMMMRRVHGVRRLVLLGVDELNEPTDLLFRDEEALALLAEQVVHEDLPLCLDRLPEGSPTIAALERACVDRAMVVIRPKASAPYIPLDERWREPERQLNSGRRSDLRRARRRAEQLGPLSTEILAPRPEELDGPLREAIAVEARSWKGARRTALAFDARRASFYRRYAQLASCAGTLRLCLLRIGGRAAAMQLAIEEAGAFWLLKVGYDERFASVSPGMLLIRDTIRYAAEKGLRSYEFLGTAEAWTRSWTRHERRCVSLRTYPLSAISLAALAADITSDAARDVAHGVYVRDPRARRLYDWMRVAWRH